MECRASESADESLLIVGASARAAAFSARRAGLNPTCADLFCDADLTASCTARRVSGTEYPEGFLPIIEEHNGPWMYTGALENYVDFVSRAETLAPLWGNSADVLRRVRDPFQLTRFSESHNFRMPSCARTRPSTGRWLVKPFHSGCGSGIRFADASPEERREGNDNVYYQEFMEGFSCSAIFVAAHDSCQLVGTSRQLTGEPELNADGFKYCGSIGPLQLPEETVAELSRLGNELASEFDLLGLFGIDFLLESTSEPCSPILLEVNPRYTASVEVIERAYGIDSLRWHMAACAGREIAPFVAGAPSSFIGKAVLFSDRDFRFPHIEAPLKWPDVADIPTVGTAIRVRNPIMTIFQNGSTPDECKTRLLNEVRTWKTRLWPTKRPPGGPQNTPSNALDT